MVGGAMRKTACEEGAALDAKPNTNMYVAICTAMMGAIMFGIDCGNFGSVQGFKGFREEWCVGNFGDETTCGEDAETGAAANMHWLQSFLQWASVMLFVGAALGSLLLAPSITANFGRRPCVSSGAFICLVGCLMTSYLSFNSVAVFLVGRFVTGFGVGVCCFALPLYNSEVSAPSIRGATGSLFQLNVVLGQMLAAVVCFMDQDWQLGMILPGIAGAVVTVAVWFTPESPRFVMAKKGFEEGAKTLALLRDGDSTDEAKEVYAQLQEEEDAGQVSFAQLWTDRSLRKRTMIACVLQFAQQFTGFNALLMYSATLFVEMGFENPFAVNMWYTAAQVVGIVVGLLLLDSPMGGRRTQLMVVTAIISPLLFLTGFAVMFEWNKTLELALVVVFAMVWQTAWGMIPWVYPSELFTMTERDRATSLAVFVQYAANALLMVVMPVILKAVGTPGMLLFFACFNLLILAFIAAFMKETKGLALEDVPALFDRSARQKVIDNGNVSQEA